MDEKKEVFQYTYSAARQAEIKNIREKYAPPAREEDKMERLCRLDKSVTKPGTIAALLVGIAGTLVMGTGMCCCMVWMLFIPGILIGFMGIAGICAAYPLYARITKKQRERLAPEILRLAEELLQ